MRRHDTHIPNPPERGVAVLTCIFCSNELTTDTKPEHILLNALGGRKTTQRVDCSACNGRFGNTIDKAIASQVEVLRNMLGMESGTGKLPPSLRNVQAGADRIHLNGDGSLDVVQKPFTLTKNSDGTTTLGINARSLEEVARHIPNIAAALKIPENKVLELLGSATGTEIHRRPGQAHFPMSFGGVESIRSFVKSCLVLWATLVGNGELKSAAFDTARKFVMDGDDEFNRRRVHFDSRPLPHEDEWKRRFGDFFNLIYIRSDETGRVIGYFSIYNIMSWHMVLAEAGGSSNRVIALVLNPLDTGAWSDTIADEVDIPFAWLETPDFTDHVRHAQQRLSVAVERSQKQALDRELESIIRGVFEKHGIAEGAAVTDPALKGRILGEISQRAAFHALDLPHEETVAGVDIVARLNVLRKNPSSRPG